MSVRGSCGRLRTHPPSAGVREQQAAYLARAVAEVAGEATQGALMAKVAESLPADTRDLVTAGSAG